MNDSPWHTSANGLPTISLPPTDRSKAVHSCSVGHVASLGKTRQVGFEEFPKGNAYMWEMNPERVAAAKRFVLAYILKTTISFKI
jgi:hypothetical protein